MAKFSIPYIRHSYCRRAYKILWGSQSTSNLWIFCVQKTISDVKTPTTSTSANAVEGDKFSIPSIYYILTLDFQTKDIYQIVKITFQPNSMKENYLAH